MKRLGADIVEHRAAVIRLVAAKASELEPGRLRILGNSTGPFSHMKSPMSRSCAGWEAA